MTITSQQKSFMTKFWRNLLSPDLDETDRDRFEHVMGQYLDATGFTMVGIENDIMPVLMKTIKKMKLDTDVFTKTRVTTTAMCNGTINVWEDGLNRTVIL